MPPLKVIDEQTIRDFLHRQRQPVYCPSSTYRLQMSARFTFRDARSILPYLHDLGIEAVYLSPIFKAVAGSLHGYDVTDPTSLNPELGTAADFDAFCEHLRKLKMGLILDTVPNHMGIARSQNALWLDVLENGPSSVYAHFFDIDWKPVKSELENKILVPILGDLYGRVLDRQEIQLEFDEERGQFFARYYDHRLPIDPQTYPILLEDGIEKLREELKKEEPTMSEYLSIVTAFKNLPVRTETDPVKVEERNREKEIAKKRLAELAMRSKSVKEFLRSRLVIANGRKGDPRSFDPLGRFLDQQVYRMAFWRTAAEEINYRRFFEINELAAVRVEDGRVFNYTHSLIFEWLSQGKVQGLRIDHPDGLYDPPAYFRRLQHKYLGEIVKAEFLGPRDGNPPPDYETLALRLARIAEKVIGEEPFCSAKPLFVITEKILDRKEFLPDDWSVHGTVGYDFLNVLNGVFIDRDRQEDFSGLYETFIGHKIDFDQLLYDKKKLFALVYMASEINTLGHLLDRISEKDRRYRDFTRNNLTLAIREAIACFPVYRTYLAPGDAAASERDERYIEVAIEKAKARTPALNPDVYDFLKAVLLLKFEEDVTAEEKQIYRDFVLRFQQITGPVMAKGLEDTSFYVYNRFVSLNEVGGDPFHFGYSKEEFHQFNKIKSERWPYGMICSSTHDTKRSEDVRMRLNVLSEIPEELKNALTRWAMINEKHKTTIRGIPEPRRNTEYFIYQALLGAWPEAPDTGAGQPLFADRIWEYVLKSVREAKTYTNWVNPNKEYEEALKKFVYATLHEDDENNFLKDFLTFQSKLSFYGKLNALSSVVLKIASPGVADFYQGSEIWNYCLVDPDNRRGIDFRLRQKLLRALEQPDSRKKQEFSSLQDIDKDHSGCLKLRLTASGLKLRRAYPEFFLDGNYVPLKVEGEREKNALAFLRGKDHRGVLVIAARFFTELIAESDSLPLGETVWQDTKILLPKGWRPDGPLRDIFTGKSCDIYSNGEDRFIRLADAFHDFSVAMLTTEGT